jgi:4-alpha-glucanotransferase
VTERGAGLLCHVTSLPGPFGGGDIGPEADRFLEWAARSGATLWQFLPVVPAGPGFSPYGGLSAFAGDPRLVSPERLVEEGILPREAFDSAAASGASSDPDAGRAARAELLRIAWQRVSSEPGLARVLEEFEAFRSSGEAVSWLSDWALFAALSERFHDAGWIHWPAELARREPAAIETARRELAPEIAFHGFLQFSFFRQWRAIRSRARELGVGLVGDLPIYVSHHSADVWVHRELFDLEPDGRPRVVAGVPPDYFSETGQLWGYPLYRWDRSRAEGDRWWIARFRAALELADLVRVDHFRAFASYWEVPASAPTAVDGRWVEGPGAPFFAGVSQALGGLPLIAEDLGTITEDVRDLLRTIGIPGMRVLQFAFSEDDSPHAPHRHVENAVAYTGTHDNDTARGWFAALSAEDRRRALDYLGGDGRDIEWDLIRAALESVAARAIVPLQDVFGLGSEARMNTPGQGAGNWRWKARREDFTPERADRFRRLVELTGRRRSSGSP